MKVLKDITPGTIIEITQRTCSDKVQKNVQRGKRFIVEKTSSLKNGTAVVEVKNPDAVGKTIRINAERFKWRVVTMDEIRRIEECTRIQADGRAKNAMLKQQFSDNEIDHILFTPYIYELLTWHYVDECHKNAAMNGLDFKKLSREADERRKAMDNEASFELGKRVYQGFCEGVQVMVEDMSAEFTRIWWHVNGEIKRAFPDMKHIDLRSYAICGMLTLRLLDEREEKSDNLINKRLGGMLRYEHKSKRSPILYNLLKGYAGDAINIDYKRLELSTKVFRNNVECIKFTTLHNEFRNKY